MKTEAILRLQAYLDNEVSSSEARQIGSWIARDSEAKALYDELAALKAAMVPANETAMAVPASREFYWSKIQRQIERTEQEPVRQYAPRPWWIRLLAPVAGAAVLAAFMFTSISFNPTGLLTQAAMTEKSHVENGTITFHSKGGMTLVWISSTPEAQAETETVTDVAAQPDEDEDAF